MRSEQMCGVEKVVSTASVCEGRRRRRTVEMLYAAPMCMAYVLPRMKFGLGDREMATHSLAIAESSLS